MRYASLFFVRLRGLRLEACVLDRLFYASEVSYFHPCSIVICCSQPLIYRCVFCKCYRPLNRIQASFALVIHDTCPVKLRSCELRTCATFLSREATVHFSRQHASSEVVHGFVLLIVTFRLLNHVRLIQTFNCGADRSYVSWPSFALSDWT